MSDEIIRVSTGIDKLDAALQGGVPKGSWVAITGEPGTGKSILCMHYAWAGLKVGDPVIYVTTEAEFRDVVRQARQFRMFLDDYEIHYLGSKAPLRKPQLVVVDIFSLLKTAKQLSADVEEIDKSRRYAALEIDVLIAAIREAYRVLGLLEGGRHSPSRHVRLIIDSLSAFWADRPAMARRYSYQLKIATHRENVTAYLVSQYAMTTKSVSPGTPIIIREDGRVKSIPVDEWSSKFFSRGETGVKAIPYKAYTLSFDPIRKVIEWDEVLAVVKHFERRPLIKIVTEDGRGILVTEDHSIYAAHGNKYIPVKAGRLRAGDLLPIPKSSIIADSGNVEGEVDTVKISRISKVDFKGFVYDLSVQKNQNFLAGHKPLIAHNSTFGFGLEHIADGVIHLWTANVEEAKEVRRFLIIKKMRMTNHYEGAFRLYIVPGKGIELRPLGGAAAGI